MAVITISIDDETERRFREVAKRVIGEKKGYLRQAVSEALHLWLEKKDQEKIAQDALELISEGHDLGAWKFSKRRDLYEHETSSS